MNELFETNVCLTSAGLPLCPAYFSVCVYVLCVVENKRVRIFRHLKTEILNMFIWFH